MEWNSLPDRCLEEQQFTCTVRINQPLQINSVGCIQDSGSWKPIYHIQSLLDILFELTSILSVFLKQAASSTLKVHTKRKIAGLLVLTTDTDARAMPIITRDRFLLSQCQPQAFQGLEDGLAEQEDEQSTVKDSIPSSCKPTLQRATPHSVTGRSFDLSQSLLQAQSDKRRRDRAEAIR